MSDPTMDRIAKALESIAFSLSKTAAPAAAASGEDVASDRDLDSQYGDPEIRKDPKDWTGDTMVGRRYSDASPEFLDMLAGLLKWKAGKNDEDAAKETDADKRGKLVKYAKYARTDAARARGWAARKRNGWKKAEPEPMAAPIGDFGDAGNAPEIPF